MSRFYGDFDPASTASTTITTGVVDTSAVVLYLPFDEDVQDDSGVGTSMTAVGNAFVQSSLTQFGAKALYLDGSGDYLQSVQKSSANSIFTLSSAAFTIDGWLYPQTFNEVISNFNAHNPFAGFTASLNFSPHAAGKLAFFTSDGSAYDTSMASSTAFALNQWSHFAIVRGAISANSLEFFINGVKHGSHTVTREPGTSNNNVRIGASNNSQPNRQFKGAMDDLRIVKGAALYSTNFSVPTTAVGNSVFIGSSTENTRTHSHVWNYIDVYDARFADTWPKNDPLASFVTTTGATAVEPGNGFRYLIFTTSGSLTVPSDAAGVSVEYLVVGGGGGGTANRGAGAGAGGLRTNVSGNPLAGSAMTLPAATYPVVVGAGGTSTTGAFPFDLATRTSGAASSFNSIESAGGGRGAAGSGGSGAGGHTTPAPASQNAGSGNVPPVTPPQGNDGGVGGAYNSGRGGGGGGAGSAGTPGGPGGGGPGAGGNGHPIPAFASPLIAPGIPSDAATAIGPTGLFAGGGGGGGSSNGLIPGGAAGPGGGGAGGRASINPGSSNPSSGEDGPAGAPGVDNTGGGGGGAGNYAGTNPKMRPGGTGGKGVVILRFPTTET